MNNWIVVALCALVGYLLGSVNTSIIVSHFLGTDIRSHGSGNAGATNTLRILGKKAAIFVLLGDLLKAVIAVLLARAIVSLLGGADANGAAPYWAGIGCVVGHNFPIYFGFKGGKGVLTGFMAVTMMDWRIGLIILGIFIILVAIFRYVSLGSVVSSASATVVALLLHSNWHMITLCVVAGILIIVRHRTNIQRLINGTESKIGAKGKEK